MGVVVRDEDPVDEVVAGRGSVDPVALPHRFELPELNVLDVVLSVVLREYTVDASLGQSDQLPHGRPVEALARASLVGQEPWSIEPFGPCVLGTPAALSLGGVLDLIVGRPSHAGDSSASAPLAVQSVAEMMSAWPWPMRPSSRRRSTSPGVERVPIFDAACNRRCRSASG